MSHDRHHAPGRARDLSGAGGEIGSTFGVRVRTFPEDPECVGVRISDREYLLTRQDAIELALQLLEAGGIALLSDLSTVPVSRRP